MPVLDEKRVDSVEEELLSKIISSLPRDFNQPIGLLFAEGFMESTALHKKELRLTMVKRVKVPNRISPEPMTLWNILKIRQIEIEERLSPDVEDFQREVLMSRLFEYALSSKFPVTQIFCSVKKDLASQGLLPTSGVRGWKKRREFLADPLVRGSAIRAYAKTPVWHLDGFLYRRAILSAEYIVKKVRSVSLDDVTTIWTEGS